MQIATGSANGKRELLPALGPRSLVVVKDAEGNEGCDVRARRSGRSVRDVFERTRWLIPPAGHDRMPVILNPINLSCGSPGNGTGIAEAHSKRCAATLPVSKRVDSSRASDDDALLVEQISPGKEAK
jgi:hypothetical protein